MAAAALPEPVQCFHCGLPVPPGLRISAQVDGKARAMCCVGCAAVAELLEGQGLADWYRYRDGPTGRAPELPGSAVGALPWLEEENDGEPFGSTTGSTTGSTAATRVATLLVQGMTCAACVWLIEQYLERLPGVQSVRVDLASHRVRVEWTPDRVALRDVIGRLTDIGFTARPDLPDAAAEIDRREGRAALIRLGVAGLGAMNVMTYAVALYAGALEGMEDGYRELFRWLSLIVTTPVVVFAARPFFVGALRDLRVRRPGMDVPVALAIGGAFAISGWATLRGAGEVYFDSACMFTFFLSAGRYLEMRARHRSAALSRRLIEAVPAVARRVVAGVEQIVPSEALEVADRFIVRPGEALAADGRVRDGVGRVEEALLTGEPWPRDVGPGDDVIAGSVNAGSPLLVEATRVGRSTTLSAIRALMDRAQSEKPAVVRAADRAAVVFVTVVLALALGTALYWGWTEPGRAVWTTLAVLIATCPCALSLATPTALAAATHGLASAGLLVTRGHVLEGLAAADRIVLDKTGTLTRGEPRFVAWVGIRDGAERQSCIDLACSLERYSEHPLARALQTSCSTSSVPRAPEPGPGEIQSVAGAGVEAKLDGVRTRFGRPDWVLGLARGSVRLPATDTVHSWALLGDERGPIAWFGFGDELRNTSEAALVRVRELGVSLEMLSGDPSAAAAALAQRLDLEVACPASTPSEKVARVRRLQADGERVVVVGDGVNDGPVLAAADVSIAMGGGSDLARLGSDAVLMRDDLRLLPQAIVWARRTRRVIRQNLGWAIGYNALALPLALSGELAPWLAAAGMSASSLVVVLNAMRLQRAPKGAA